MYNKSYEFYDAIYSSQIKDYQAEARQLHDLIQQHKRTTGNTLLDVACGTGSHIPFLLPHYILEGLDIEAGMLVVARDKFPDVLFHEADMVDFQLGKQFDVITCLFSAIGYVHPTKNLQEAIANMADHLYPGGVLIVEPWIHPEEWRVGHPSATFVDLPDIKIARMAVSQREGNMAVMDMHHTVCTTEGVEHFVEVHQLYLYSHEEYMGAFQAAGLETYHDPTGLIGRGLYVGVKREDR